MADDAPAAIRVIVYESPKVARAALSNLYQAPDTSFVNDEIATFQPWRARFVRSEWVTPTYGLASGAIDSGPTTVFTDTIPIWRPTYLRSPSYFPAVRRQRGNRQSDDDATSYPASPGSAMFVTYEGREYVHPRYLYYQRPDVSATAPVVPPPTGTHRRAPEWMRRLELEMIR